MSSPNPSSTDPSSLNSGPTNELGRTRGSSATSVPAEIVSPTPQRGVQTQIARMSAVAAGGGDGQGLSPGSDDSDSDSGSVVIRTLVRRESSASNSSSGMEASEQQVSRQYTGDRDGSAGEAGFQFPTQYNTCEGATKVVLDFSANLQRRLVGLKQSIRETPGLPDQIQDDLIAITNDIGREFSNQQTFIQLALENARKDHLFVLRQLETAETRVLAANFDRDDAYTQTDELRLKKQKSMEKLKEAVEDLKQSNTDLLRQIEYQEDQLKGKRPSWVEKNPGSSTRRSTGSNPLMDPFNSPLANTGTSAQRNRTKKANFAGGMMGSFGSTNTSTNDNSAFRSYGVKRGNVGKSNPPSGNSSFNSSVNTSFEHPNSSSTLQSPFVSGVSPPINPTPLAGRLRRRGALPTGSLSAGSLPIGNLPIGNLSLGNLPIGRLPADNLPIGNYRSLGGPPVGSPPRGRLPTRNLFDEFESLHSKQSIMDSLNNLPRNTQPGTPKRSTTSPVLPHDGSFYNGLDDFNVDENLIQLGRKYETTFIEFFDLVEDWCKQYASIPNAEFDDTISTSDEALWKYMMNMIYPDSPQDSEPHVKALLQDTKCRYMFTMRMIINYCIRDVVTVEEFEYFDPEMGKTLTQCRRALRSRGLISEIRQPIVDRQTKAVEAITKLETYDDFRQSRIKFHTQQLRDMLGPLLNNHIPRIDAGKDLAVLAEKAFDTGVRLHTSNLTFEVHFPDTTSKFNLSTMTPKDQGIYTPLELQFAQFPLKLVITPVVTMRDDRGTVFRAKMIHKAKVVIKL